MSYWKIMSELLSIPYFNCVFFFFPFFIQRVNSHSHRALVHEINFICMKPFINRNFIPQGSQFFLCAVPLPTKWNSEIKTDWDRFTENWLIFIDCIQANCFIFVYLVAQNTPKIDYHWSPGGTQPNCCRLFTKFLHQTRKKASI